MQENTTDLIVIMPLYNEAATINNTLLQWIKTLTTLNIKYYIDIYNDGSTDNSAEIVSDISKKYPTVRLHNCKHRGFSQTLYEAYCQVRNTEFVFHADSDNEISPTDFLKIWDKRNNADLIIGKRLNRKQSFPRKLVSSISTFVVSFLFNKSGNNITDTNIPFRLFKNSILKEFLNTINHKYPYPNLFISAYFLQKQMNIFEVGIEYNDKNIKKSYLDKMPELIKQSFLSFIYLLKYRFSA